MTEFFMIIATVLTVVILFYLIKRFLVRRIMDWVQLSFRAHTTEVAIERAEALLRASISPQEYALLRSRGYLEIPSRLHPNRIYQIPRDRRRVRVYEILPSESQPQYKKLGELCVISCTPVPDADMVLTHKWLLEADERNYLATANWISSIYT
ncbi:MAG: hypothetical protein R3C14_26965 [Caldilineaceae bacterium]